MDSYKELPSKPGIYKITSPSGKIYIGQSKNVKYRIQKHLYESKRSSLPVHNAIKKYGLSGLDIKCVFELKKVPYESIVNILNELEKAFIKFYDSYNNGYNLTEGGDSNIQTEETRRKISIANSNPSKETMDKRRKSLFASTRFSEDSIRRIEAAKTRRVAKLDIDGNIIEEFNSINEAALSVGVCNSNICAQMAGRSKTCGGYR